MKCMVCGENAEQVFSHKILAKYPCAYFYCNACGFLQTEKPYWLDEAYSSAIAAADTGLIQRNLYFSKMLSVLLYSLFDRKGRYLDVAGGYGMLTRLMRDSGFDFYWSDKYCQNLFAQGFEVVPASSYAAVTAFEVMEHLPDPVEFVKDSLGRTDTRTMIFSTVLYKDRPPAPGSWWYYAFETGQHISFYQRRTLHVIAKKLGVNCYSNTLFHVFSANKINPYIYHFLTNPVISRLLPPVPILRFGSKTNKDHLDIIEKSRANK